MSNDESTVAADVATDVKKHTITDPSNYKVLPSYDNDFTKTGKLTTITELIKTREAQQTDRLTVDFFKQQGKKSKHETLFLFMVILRITVPSAKPDSSYHKFKPNAFSKKLPQRASYKKCLLLADLGDPNQLTAVILEESNDDHNLYFSRDLSLMNVAVGQRLVVQSPKLDGNQLKNGAWVLKTNRPLEFVSDPRLPTRLLRSENVGHELRYFVIKSTPIFLMHDDVIDPLRTMCNFHACDRQNAKAIRTHTNCGCWMQNKRMDNSPRNTVLMFTFYFPDQLQKIIQVKDFTSLRTSKLFFKDGNILAEADDLNKNSVYAYMQTQWRQTVDHVNSNGGWTIIGWFIRATVDEDDKEEQDEMLLRTNVKINVSFLYPSTKKGQAIPNDRTIHQEKITELLSNTTSATEMADSSDNDH
jgi:hypothetical protein